MKRSIYTAFTCDWEYQKNLYARDGGKVDHVCCLHNCDYVMKRIPLILLDELAENIGPYLAEAWIEIDEENHSYYGYMVTEKLNPLVLTKQRAEIIMAKLDKLHQLGWCHGDIHRNNIMMNADGEPFIIDYGWSHPKTDYCLDLKEFKQFLALKATQ